ncbi:DDB1- and CUL4-associated factor 8-like [Suncus etruscus]|uniref:DDB1- and CUL4-associated factor 8-like n=1 Tax=Suncus etruscus TaxID=109475 RepID=UPI00210F47B2|nr:DDB1- and CUL4-associated factor 8-like [Suncus etruscus]
MSNRSGANDVEEEEASSSQDLVRSRDVDVPQGQLEQELEEALENWVASEVSLLPRPCWQVVSALRNRQLGSRANFVSEACGSRALLQRFQLQRELKGHVGGVSTLQFNESGAWLTSSGDDMRVIIWDWMQQRALLNFDSGFTSNVYQAKFLPNSGDTAMAMCGSDGQVRVAQLCSSPACQTIRRVAQHEAAAHSLALVPHCPHRFLTSGEDAAVYHVDLRLDQPASKLLILKKNRKRVGLYTIFVNPNNIHEFAVGGQDPVVRIYDKRKMDQRVNNAVLKKFCPPHLCTNKIKPSISSLVYSYDGTELLASYNDEDIYLFNTNGCDEAQYVRRYKGHRNTLPFKGVNFYGPRSQFVVSGSDCGHLFFWEKSSSQIVQCFHGDQGVTINCVEPHPHLPVIASCGLDVTPKIWGPSSTVTTDPEGTKILMKKNKQQRDAFYVCHRGNFENFMIWGLMHHLRS